MTQVQILEGRRELNTKVLFGGGRNKEETAKEQVTSYLELSRGLSEKIEAGMLAIYERVLSTNQVEVHAAKIGTLEYFHGMLNKQINLVERRVIWDEQIQAEEGRELGSHLDKGIGELGSHLDK